MMNQPYMMAMITVITVRTFLSDSTILLSPTQEKNLNKNMQK
jgi:hypothetical protein